MPENPNTPDTLPEGGEGADDIASVKDVLGEVLGKEFPTDEAALKSVKDTFAYVGKVGKFQPILDELQKTHGGDAKVVELLTSLKEGKLTMNQPIDESKFVPKDQYESDSFFQTRKELQPYRPLIEALKANNPGKNNAEIVEMPEFKSVYEKASAYEKQESEKSVLMSSNRLGNVSDKMEQARTALKEDNFDVAKSSAVGAVMDAYEIGGNK